MPIGGILAATAAPILTGAIGHAVSSGSRDAAKEATRKALEAITGIKVPTVGEQSVHLAQNEYTGDFTPEMAATYSQDPSLMAGIEVDPRLKDAQLQSLAKYTQMGDRGFTAQGKADLMASLRELTGGANAAAKTETARDLASGTMGSGKSLVARQIAAQAAANRGVQAALGISAQGATNAQQAIANAGNLAGSMSSQEFAQQAAKAQAQDSINQFNTSNRQNISNMNTAQRNNAQLRNLDARQNLKNSNVQIKNQQQLHNKGLIQQQFQNEMAKGSATANAYGGQASNENANAQATQNMWGGIGQGISQAGTAVYAANTKAKEKKDQSVTSTTNGQQ